MKTKPKSHLDRLRGRISKGKRLRVYYRDGFRCVECRLHQEELKGDNRLTLDHIRPLIKGGTNDDENLQTMCQDCNGKKKADWRRSS